MNGPLSFFPNDRAKDVDPLTMEERGMYFTIMRHEWPNGGPIPMDEIDRLIEKPWLSTRDVFRRRFAEKDGCVLLVWVEEEREKRALFSQKQAAKGRLGGRPIKGKKPKKTRSLTDANPLSSPRVGKGISMGKGIDSEKERVYEPEIWPTFTDFWEGYDKKTGKPNAMDQWAKLDQRDREAAMQAIPDYIMSKPDKKFRPDPERFLKHRKWEDEIIVDTVGNGGAHGKQTHEERKKDVAERISRILAEDGHSNGPDPGFGL